MINMDHNLMQARNVSPTDVLNAVNAQSLVLPSGTVKLGESELDVRTNTSPRTVTELNDLPIKQVGTTTIYLRDVPGGGCGVCDAGILRAIQDAGTDFGDVSAEEQRSSIGIAELV